MAKRLSLRRRSPTPVSSRFLFSREPLLCDATPSASSEAPLAAIPDRRDLRQQLRARRRRLDHRQQKIAAIQLSQRLLASSALLRTRHLALYLPHDGEIDPRPLIAPLTRRGIQVYLPVLRPFAQNSLWFVRLSPSTQLVRNRFGILEPATRNAAHPSRRLPGWALSTLLMPLVGFDQQGGRLGMGGGFYDRSLAFTRTSQGPRPRLYGIAHAVQEVDNLPLAHWDIPLDAVITPDGWWTTDKT